MVDGDASVFSYDAANEIMLIAAAIADKQKRLELTHKISSDEFLVPAHRPIWRALRSMSDAQLDYSSEVAKQFVRREGGADDAIDHLMNIDPAVPENLSWHVDTMKWDATRARVLKTTVPALIDSIKDPKAGAGDVVSSARAVIRALEDQSRSFMRRPNELYRIYRAELASRRAERNMFPLGESEFDQNLTEGFMPGRTTVTAGLPGAGKSTVWITNMIRLAKIGRRPLICAWEMDPESILDIATSHMTGVDLKNIVQGTLTDEETDKVDRASRWINNRIRFMGNPFYATNSNGKPSNYRNLDMLEGYLAESGCDVALYDLWERMLPYRKPDDVSAALFRMQDIHSKYRVHGVIVNQLLLKDVEKRADKRPTRESIKGTGAYVEVADLIFGVHREAQFKNVPDDTVETICLKQRKGRPNWAVRWKWDGATCHVSNPEEIPYDPGFDSAAEVDDVFQIKVDKGKGKKGKPKPIGRRD